MKICCYSQVFRQKEENDALKHEYQKMSLEAWDFKTYGGFPKNQGQLLRLEVYGNLRQGPTFGKDHFARAVSRVQDPRM